MDWYLNYSREVADHGKLLMLLVPEHPCILRSTKDPTDLPFGGHAEIGTYRSTVPTPLLEELRSEVLAALKAPRTRKAMTMGTPLVAFGAGTMGDASELIAFPISAPLPPAARRIDERMLAIAATLVRHPYRTLQGQLTWRVPEIHFADVPRLQFAVRNTGKVPVKLPNPAGAAEEGKVGLSVYFYDDQSAQAPVSAAFSVRRDELAQESAPGAEPGDEPAPLVALQPGEELVVSINPHRHCYLSPGRYRGGVLVTTGLGDIPEEEGVEGQIQAETGPLTVTARAKP